MTVNNNKIALITGASRGIGAAIAKRLAANGYEIWANYQQNTEAAEKLAAEIEANGVRCRLLKFDVRNESQVNEILQPLLEEHAPDVLINNAGILKDTIMMWMSADEWQSVTDTTLNGFFNVTKAVLLGMMRRRSGKIINIVSTAGQNGLAGQTNYSAAKAGLIGATKSLAKEVIKKGVYVNAVSPGFIETDMTKNLPVDEIKKYIPIGRIGKPEEVASVVEFLASDQAGYIVGQVISVNGGMYM